MARKNLIESSDHFNEIVKRLSEGESGASVSKWLKDSFNEDISTRTLNRYKSKNIKMEDRVEAELNRRAKKKKSQKKKSKIKEDKSKEVQAKTESEVQRQADIVEEAEETVNTVAEIIANNMQGVAKVAGELPDMFRKTKADAANPDIPNVTFKDAANLTIQANKIFAEYFKDNEPDIEVNVNNEVIGLSDSIEQSRQKYVKWKEEQLKKKE